MEKPDWKEPAKIWSNDFDDDIKIEVSHSFKKGCEHVWNTHVVPLGLKNANLEDWNRELIEKLKASESENKALREENLRLQNRISSLENICEMDRKTEYQYNQLYKEKEALREEIEILKDQILEQGELD